MANIEEMGRDEGIKKIRALIKDIQFCMLTTMDAEGRLHSRPMAATDVDEFDGQLWFFTYAHSHKTADVNRNHQVNCAYADPNRQTYVSIAGDARLVRDRDEIRRRWKPQYKAWFQNGVDDPEVALLHVTVEKAEYWDAPSNPVATAVGFVKTQVFGGSPNVGENKVVNLQ